MLRAAGDSMVGFGLLGHSARVFGPGGIQVTRISKPAVWAALGVGLMGLALLGGCSRGGGNAAAGAGPAAATGGGPAAPAASGPDISINAADMPHLKAGYWEAVTTTNGQERETHRFCSAGKPMAPPAQMGRGCSTFSFKRTFLGAYVIDASCAEGPVASKLHMTASGDFDASYVTDGQASITMQGRPATTFTTHTQTRYLGPCPAGAAAED
jgi:hypothetical protein